MSGIPSNLTRVPNLLSSQILLSSLTRTNLSLLEVQTQLATGRLINRPSDDAVRASTISIIDDRLERAGQRERNLLAARTSLNFLDGAVGDASDLVLEAISIASSQIGVTSDAETRNSQAVVINSMIQQLFQLANREVNGLHVFGGSTSTSRPVHELSTGYRYLGRGNGLINDLGIGEQIPITIGAGNVIGETSSRIVSPIDLDPALTDQTRLDRVSGARGLGIAAGVIEFAFGGGPTAQIDLTGVSSAGDVADALTSAIQQYESDNGVTVLGAGGVSLVGGQISVDVVAGPDQLAFADIGGGSTGADLGLTQNAFSAGSPLGADIGPQLTLDTPLTAIAGLTLPLDSIRFQFASGNSATSSVVDLSSAQSVDDIRSLIESQVEGVRVEVNAAGSGLSVISEISGPAFSIEEVAGGANTATELGIRSLAPYTSISDFNDGRGVRIVTGGVDPISGVPDPNLDVDFVISLGDGSSFTVDLQPGDLTSVQTVLDRINAQAADAVTAGDIPAGSFNATLSDDGNGIVFEDLLGLGAISVAKKNNSAAAEDLGLLNGSYDAGSATFVAQDRAQVRVDSLFTALIQLRDALQNNDATGITVAGERLEEMSDRLATTRALVGVYGQRVDQASDRLDDQRILDEQVRSELRDLDFTEASIRYNLLQTQLQAGLASGARLDQLSLLDFLR